MFVVFGFFLIKKQTDLFSFPHDTSSSNIPQREESSSQWWCPEYWAGCGRCLLGARPSPRVLCRPENTHSVFTAICGDAGGAGGEEQLFTYTLLDAELQSAVLDHVDAVVIVSWSEETFALLQLNKHHVTTQLQEQGLVKVSQDPTGGRTQTEFTPGRQHNVSVSVWVRPTPDILQHVEDLRGQIGGLHVELRQVSLQQRGRGLLGLQGGRIFSDPKYSVERDQTKTTKSVYNSPVNVSLFSLRPVPPCGPYLRAMLRTLVLLRTRCGCFTEVDVDGGIEDNVWTLKTNKTKMCVWPVTFRNRFIRHKNSWMETGVWGEKRK